MHISHFNTLRFQSFPLFLEHEKFSHCLWPEENSKHFPNAQYFQPVALRSGLEIEPGQEGVAKWHFYSRSVMNCQ